MRKKKRLLALLICLALVFALPMAAGAEDLNLTPEQRNLYSQMLKSFIAPDFCGKSMVECPAKITVDMREGILKQVQEGNTKEQIIDYWTGVYGTKILAAPPKSGFFLSAWILPILGLIAGVFIVGVAVKGRLRGNGGQKASKKPSESKISQEYENELKEEILKHL